MLILSLSSSKEFVVLRIYERSRGVLCSVFLGKVSVIWLLATMEALSQVEGLKEFVKSSKVGNKAFIALHCSNKHGCFLAVAEYGGGGWKGLVVILKGRGGRVGEVLRLSCKSF